jgi:DNA-binding NarL/FixJ family response regulator
MVAATPSVLRVSRELLELDPLETRRGLVAQLATNNNRRIASWRRAALRHNDGRACRRCGRARDDHRRRTATSAISGSVILRSRRPHLILLDLELDGAANIGLVSTITANANTAVFAFTNVRSPETIQGALLAGAKSVINKMARTADIVKAIDRVPGGELWTDRALSSAFSRRYLRPTARRVSAKKNRIA